MTCDELVSGFGNRCESRNVIVAPRQPFSRRSISQRAVDGFRSQKSFADRFPEIPRDEFRRAMAFIEPDGEAFLAAEAVYRSLGYRSSRKWLAWSYDHVPGFAAISETAYKFIARHRGLGSTFTRLLWGKDVRPPTYFWARRWFLRMLGLIYLIAFKHAEKPAARPKISRRPH